MALVKTTPDSNARPKALSSYANTKVPDAKTPIGNGKGLIGPYFSYITPELKE
jgi:hypothetical protein